MLQGQNIPKYPCIEGVSPEGSCEAAGPMNGKGASGEICGGENYEQ